MFYFQLFNFAGLSVTCAINSQLWKNCWFWVSLIIRHISLLVVVAQREWSKAGFTM